MKREEEEEEEEGSVESDTAWVYLMRMYMLSEMLEGWMVFCVSLCVVYLAVLLFLVVVLMLCTPKIQ